MQQDRWVTLPGGGYDGSSHRYGMVWVQNESRWNGIAKTAATFSRIGPTNTTTWLLDVRRSRVLWPDEATKLWGGPGMVLILVDCWSFGLLDSRLCDD